jgi:hypothetical protein
MLNIRNSTSTRTKQILINKSINKLNRINTPLSNNTELDNTMVDDYLWNGIVMAIFVVTITHSGGIGIGIHIHIGI